MKILILSQLYKPEPNPKHHELAEALVKQGNTVTIKYCFLCNPGDELYPGYKLALWRTEAVNGVKIIRVLLYPRHKGRVAVRILNHLSFFLSASLLCPFLLNKTDIMYIWGN